ncbi:hypothetical protein [Halococcus sp. AFM35]
MSVRKHRATVGTHVVIGAKTRHADSRIDDTDRLLIDTEETRVTIDPR